MNSFQNRRRFLKNTSLTTLGLGITGLAGDLAPIKHQFNKKKLSDLKDRKIGIIGLDTSHSVEFTRALNDPLVGETFSGYRVVAAYPYGSRDIVSSVERIPKYTEEIKKLGVGIVNSIDEVLKRSDVVLLETNDGRLHLEQALPVLKAGKRLFIDKPVAASLSDAMAIFEAAENLNVPVFSSSPLRFNPNTREIGSGKIAGRVLGADVFSPCILEKTHPDLFWYGIHGVETLFTLMGQGCKEVSRIHTTDTDIVVGTWNDNRAGVFRGIRTGKKSYGGTAFGENSIAVLEPFAGYKSLLMEVIEFFKSGKAPVSPEETLEICAFMEAADESKRKGGAPVSLQIVIERAGLKYK